MKPFVRLEISLRNQNGRRVSRRLESAPMDRAGSDCETEADFDRSNSSSMEGVISELENLESICNKLLEKFSTPSSKLCGTSQSQKASEQVEVKNSLQRQPIMEIKGECISRNSQEYSGKSELPTNITSPSCEHLEDRQRGRMGSRAIRFEGLEKSESSDNVNSKPCTVAEAVYLAPVGTLGGTDKLKCQNPDPAKEDISLIRISNSVDSETDGGVQHLAGRGCWMPTEGDVLSTPDDGGKVEKQWEDMPRISSGNVSTSASTNVLQSYKIEGEKVCPQNIDCDIGRNSGAFGENETPSSSMTKQPCAATTANVLNDKPLLKFEPSEQYEDRSPSTLKANSFSVLHEDSMPGKGEKRKIQATGLTTHKRSREVFELPSSSTDITEYCRANVKTRIQASRQISNRSEENVPSEHSMRKINDSNNDGESERPLASSVWKSTAQAKGEATTAEPEVSLNCEHKHMDFDELMGFYCDDCGYLGM